MRLRFLAFPLFIAIAAGARPAAAQTAVCRDSTVSYSRLGSEVCAGHGGVARWKPEARAEPRPSPSRRSADGAVSPTRRTATRSTTPRRATSRASQSTRRASSRRSSASSRVYHTGPRGGCYYYSASGRKNYVDHSWCR